MPERALLEDRIARLFEDRLNLVVPSPDTDLFATGGMDSMSFVELLLAIEEKFAVKVSIEELEIENFQSITRIAEFVANRREFKVGKQVERALDGNGLGGSGQAG